MPHDKADKPRSKNDSSARDDGGKQEQSSSYGHQQPDPDSRELTSEELQSATSDSSSFNEPPVSDESRSANRDKPLTSGESQSATSDPTSSKELPVSDEPRSANRDSGSSDKPLTSGESQSATSDSSCFNEPQLSDESQSVMPISSQRALPESEDPADAHKSKPGASNDRLRIDEDMPLHEKGWRIQRIAWIVLAVFLTFAALGLFGTGPLSEQTIAVAGDSCRYERFMRYESEARLNFDVYNVKDTLRISFPQRYRQFIDITAIEPSPERNIVNDGIVTYYFAANGHTTVRCTLMATKTGRVSETFTVNGHNFKITHLIYP